MAEYVVKRSETIEAAPQTVFANIGDLRKWEQWSPWEELDPEMTKTFNGDQGEVGSSYHWSGNRKVGEGQMTMAEIVADERVAIDLEFIKPFRSKSVTKIELTPVDDATRVTWRMTGEQTFMTRVMGFIGKSMEKMVGPDLEKGLTNLKRVSES